MKVARTEERTAHGLWVVHQAISERRRRDPDFDWCAYLNAGKPIPLYMGRHNYSNVEVIRRCANRYCRRFKLKTVRQYNGVIDRICERRRSMHNTHKAALLSWRESIWLVFAKDKNCRVAPKFDFLKVFERRDRICNIRESRQRKEEARKEEIKRLNAKAFCELEKTENELRVIRRAIRNAQSALRSATQ